MTISKEQLENLENDHSTDSLELRYTIGGPDEGTVHESVRMTENAARTGQLNAGYRELYGAEAEFQNEFAFKSREGQARADFQSGSEEIRATDLFNGYADEAGRAEHDLLVAEERLANAVDEYIEHYDDQDLEPTPEMVQKVEELNREAVLTEGHRQAVHNNGLPLDPPLDMERETYIRETTDKERELSTLTRDQYIEQTTQPNAGRPIDRTHDR